MKHLGGNVVYIPEIQIYTFTAQCCSFSLALSADVCGDLLRMDGWVGVGGGSGGVGGFGNSLRMTG